MYEESKERPIWGNSVFTDLLIVVFWVWPGSDLDGWARWRSPQTLDWAVYFETTTYRNLPESQLKRPSGPERVRPRVRPRRGLRAMHQRSAKDLPQGQWIGGSMLFLVGFDATFDVCGTRRCRCVRPPRDPHRRCEAEVMVHHVHTRHDAQKESDIDAESLSHWW